MKIALAYAHESLVDVAERFARAARDRGHDLSMYRLPHVEDDRFAPEQAAALRLLPIPAQYERLVVLDSSTWFLRHDRKIVWFAQESFKSNATIGTAIAHANRVSLAESHGVLAASPAARDVLRTHYDVANPQVVDIEAVLS